MPSLSRCSIPFIALAASALAPSSASAQFAYVATETNRAFSPLSGGTSVSFTGGTNSGAGLVALGFTFSYFGNDYTHVNIGVDGLLTFAAACDVSTPCTQGSCNATGVCEETTLASGTFAFPRTTTPNRFVAAFWEDLFIRGNAAVTHATLGTAPNRTFVVEWEDIQLRFATTSPSEATFQIRLEEGSNLIGIHYGDFSSGTDSTRWFGIIGAESPDGSRGLTSRTCSSNNNCRATDLANLENKVIEIILPDGAELTGEATGPTGGGPGDPLPVSLTVRNIGTNTTTVGFESRVYISSDATLDRNDTLLGTLNFPALAAGGSATRTLDTTVPSGLGIGTYTLGALVDTSSVVPEAIESNNVVIAQSRFLIGSDLALGDIPAPATGGIGDPLSLTIPVANAGSAQTAVAVDVYLSADTVLDGTDTKIGTATTAVGAVPLTNVVVTSTVPSNLMDGAYRVIAVVDPGNRITESDETNNVRASTGEISFVSADLYVPRIVVDRAIGFRGESLMVTVDIENDGGSNARGFDYEFRFSLNELISRAGSDPLVGEFGPLTVPAGQVRTVTHEIQIPPGVAIAEYYVGIIVNANGRVSERNTRDNIRRTPTKMVIRDPGPDFSVGQILSQPSAAAGERLVIERAIFNLGNAGGTTAYDVWLSEDTSVDPMTDVLLTSGSATIGVSAEDFGLDVVRLSPTQAAGNYYVVYRLDGPNVVDELNEENNVAATEMPIPVVTSRLAILTDNLPFATVGVPYEVQLGATGGAAPPVWSVPAGALPEGLMLSAEGSITGTPAREELSRFTLQVTDGLVSAVRDFTVLVSEQSEDIEVVTRILPPAYVDRPYEQSLTVYGGVPPYTWELRGLLPEGMVLDPEGILRGRPMQSDLRMFPVRVIDALGASDDRVLILKVVRQSQSLRLATDAIPDGRIGDTYTATFRAIEATGTAPFIFTITDGMLPDGLTLTDDTISGVPEKAGDFDITVRVTDADGDNDANRFLIEIGESNGVRFLTTTIPDAEIGAPYVSEDGSEVRLRAISEQGSDGVVFEIVQGGLPDGVTLSSDGAVTGTPGRRGPFEMVVRAVDTAGQETLRAFGLLVNDPPTPAPPPVVAESCRCVQTTPTATLPGLGLFVLGLGLMLRRGRRRRLLPLAVALLSLSAATPARAQTFDYVVSERTEAYVERTGGTAIRFPFSDDSSSTITLPFDFQFYGQTFNQVSVSTNGYVAMGNTSAQSLSNRSMPSTFAPNNIIALWWDDLESTGEEWFVDGTAPNRVATIQYKNANRLGAATAGRVRVQLRLFEGRSRFEIHYGGVAGATSGSAFWTFSAGYEDTTGNRGSNLFRCAGSCNRPDVPNNRVFLIQEDGGPDLVVNSVRAPLNVFPGTPVTVNIDFGSIHANPLGPFNYELYLLPAGATTPSGSSLSSSTIQLSPFARIEQSITVTVPANTALGRYRFALALDTGGALNEPDEANNIGFSDFVRAVMPRPDLYVPEVRSVAPTAAPGGPLDVRFVYGNQGSVPTSGSWQILLSKNAVVTVDDQVIGSGTEMLAASSNTGVSRSITLPNDLPTGSYTLGVVVDAENAVVEASEINNVGIATEPVLIAQTGLGIADTALAPLYVRVPYTSFLTPIGGDGSYDWQITSGTLPRGVTLVPTTGELRGTPTDLGPSTFTVQVSSGGEMASATFMVEVVEPIGGFTITTRQLIPAVVGANYPPGDSMDVQRVRTLGGMGAVTFSLDSPPPPGIELSSDGVFSGIPIQSGRFSIDLRAEDAAMATATKTLFLTVGEPGRITLISDPLPDGTVGSPYQARLRHIGAASTATPTYASMGPLPPGLIVASSGVIGGTPREPGNFTFPVTVSEGPDGTGQLDTALFEIAVTADDSLSIRRDGTSTATVGQSVRLQLIAIGGTPPFAWRGGEDLPDGLEADVEGGEGNVYEISGSLSEEGLVTILVQLTDADQRVVQEAVSVRFLPEPPAPPPTASSGCASVSGTGGASGSLLGLVLILLVRGRRRRRLERA